MWIAASWKRPPVGLAVAARSLRGCAKGCSEEAACGARKPVVTQRRAFLDQRAL